MKLFQATLRLSARGVAEVTTQDVSLLAENYAEAEEKINANYKGAFIYNLMIVTDEACAITDGFF